MHRDLPREGSPERWPAADLVYVYQLLDGFFRGPTVPMRLGEQVALTGMRAEVTGLSGDGRVSEARVRFDASVDDPSLTWLRWDWPRGAYVPFVPPAIGETVRVPGPFERRS